MFIRRKSFTVDVPDGANADRYIESKMTTIIEEEEIFEHCIVSVNEREYDGIFHIVIYYRSEDR